MNVDSVNGDDGYIIGLVRFVSCKVMDCEVMFVINAVNKWLVVVNDRRRHYMHVMLNDAPMVI